MYVASYTLTGVFAIQGLSDCNKNCLNGTAMEMFVNYADFDSKNADQTAMLNVSLLFPSISHLPKQLHVFKNFIYISLAF